MVTRVHSSRMRTARSLTLSRSICHTCTPHHTPPTTHAPPPLPCMPPCHAHPLPCTPPCQACPPAMYAPLSCMPPATQPPPCYACPPPCTPPTMHALPCEQNGRCKNITYEILKYIGRSTMWPFSLAVYNFTHYSVTVCAFDPCVYSFCHLVAILATKRRAGVAPEVNLRIPLWWSKQAKESTLALKPRGDITRSPKHGYQWLHKKTVTRYKSRILSQMVTRKQEEKKTFEPRHGARLFVSKSQMPRRQY